MKFPRVVRTKEAALDTLRSDGAPRPPGLGGGRRLEFDAEACWSRYGELRRGGAMLEWRMVVNERGRVRPASWWW